MGCNMKKPMKLIILFLLMALLAGISLAFYMSRDYAKIDARRESLRAKIEQLKEGDDETLVLKILGQPTSIETIKPKDLGFRIQTKFGTVLLYRYDINLGRMPLTVEGALRASIAVYLDDATKKVVKLDWLIF